ncbi:MAG: metallophosphoesterase family protein [Phycisphaerales bacterium]|nr:metallophosphoesterase family protein [Phycisphaerales bacterium]
MPDRSYVVAVVSDIHGNAAALRMVLSDLANRPHDELVFAGDYVLFGPRPAEALTLIREQNCPAVYGNTDRFVTHGSGPAALRPVAEWAQRRLGDDDIRYLCEMPFQHRITPPGGASPDDDLLIVHATPTDVDAVLILGPDAFSENAVTPVAEAQTLVGSARAGLIVYGHIHYASSGSVDGQRLASVGSVGFPFDGDQRAAYALATWNGVRWTIKHRRVEYDHATVADELEQTDIPLGAITAQRIRSAGYIKHTTD